MERLYYKPHFGPEETDEMLHMEDERVRLQKKFVRQQLLDQINLKNNMRLRDFHDERFGELAASLASCQGVPRLHLKAQHYDQG